MILLDNIKLIDFGLIFKKDEDVDEYPSTNDITVTVPDMPGAYDFGATLGVKALYLPLVFIADSKDDLERKKREFIKFIIDQRGKPRTFKLSYEYAPYKYYNVRYSGQMSIRRLIRFGEFELPLRAFDPYAYSTVTSDEVLWGSEIVTFEYYYTFGHTGGNEMTVTAPQVIDVYVDGDMIRPIIEINGSGNNVGFSANGKSFNLGDFTNKEIIVKGDDFTVTEDGQNSFDRLEGDFLELFSGQNDIEITGDSLDFELKIKFRDKYM